MSFLSAIAAKILEWGLTKLWALAKAFAEKMENRAANKSAAEQSVEPLKNAQTGEEIDKATDSTLGGL